MSTDPKHSLYLDEMDDDQDLNETNSIPTASTASPDSLRTPPEVSQAPTQVQSYGSKFGDGRLKSASIAIDDLSIFEGDPFGLDDILRCPSHFQF